MWGNQPHGPIDSCTVGPTAVPPSARWPRSPKAHLQSSAARVTETQRYYEYGWKLVEVSSFAPMQLSRISADAVASTRFVGLTGKAIGGQYANQAIRTLKVMLNKAKEWRLIAEVPSFKLRKAAGRQLTFSEEDEAGILMHASQDVGDVFIQIQDRDAANGGLQDSVTRCLLQGGLHLRTGIEDRSGPPQGSHVRGAQGPALGTAEEVEVDLGLPGARRRGTPSSRSWWVFATLAVRRKSTLAKSSTRRVTPSGPMRLAASQNLPAVMKAMGHPSVNSTLPYRGAQRRTEY